MGFRNDAYATVWEVRPHSETCTKVKISITKKKQGTDEYEQEFNEWTQFVGTNAAPRALKLKEKDKIKLKSVDVRTLYNKEKEKKYYFFNIWDFEKTENTPKPTEDVTDPQPVVDSGEVEEDGLPF